MGAFDRVCRIAGESPLVALAALVSLTSCVSSGGSFFGERSAESIAENQSSGGEVVANEPRDLATTETPLPPAPDVGLEAPEPGPTPDPPTEAFPPARAEERSAAPAEATRAIDPSAGAEPPTKANATSTAPRRAETGRRTELATAPEPAPRAYVLLEGVEISPAVESKLARIAERYFARTGKRLVCTSGTRDPVRQASAVYDLLRLGADVMRLYRNKEAARELVRIFLAGRARTKSESAIVSELADAIRRQMDRGVYLSAHLTERAVDVRSRDMTPADRRAFYEAVAGVGGVSVLFERVPPHLHLQLD